MTVSATTNRVSYTGSGTNGPFSFAYPVQTLTDMGAALQNIADGTIIPLTYGVDYTASGTAVANFGYPAGVTISLMASSPLVVGGTLGVGGTLPSTYNIAIFRKSPPTQGTSIPQAGPLPSKPLEASMDELALALQRSYDLSNRSLRLADGYTKPFSLTLPKDMFLNPGASLSINATGDGVDYGPSAASLNAAVAAAQAAATAASGSATSASGSAAAASASASAIAGAITTQGDMVVGNVSGAPSRLAIGSNGQVLGVVGGIPTWVASTGFTNPMTTTQDLIVGGASGAAARLGVGGNGQVLTVVGGAVQWANATTGFVNPMTTVGDIIIGGGAGAATRLAGGTNGYVLTMVSGSPAWAAASVGFVNPMTAAGDIIIGGASGTATRLAKATDGQVLTLVSGSPAWANTGFVTPQTTKGDTIMFSTIPVAHAVPGDYGHLIADSSKSDGWRSTSFNEMQGSPGKNLIQYADFENGATTGWALGLTGALVNGLPSAAPTFGSGAAGGLSLAASSSSPIDGAYHMNIASSGATTAGNMVHSSANVPVPLAYQAKMLTVSFDYSMIAGASNGNYSGSSSNSFAVAVYDVTNLAWIPVVGAFNFTQNAGVGTFTGQFQTASNTANLRFCLYFPNASAGAITMAVKNFFIGKMPTPRGAFVGDWKQYTPTYTGFGTVTGSDMWYRQVGDSIELKGRFVSGTITGATAAVGLPNGWTIDSTKVPTIRASGYYLGVNGTGRTTHGGALLALGGNTGINFGDLGTYGAGSMGNSMITAQTGTAIAVSGDVITIDGVVIPITGMSSAMDLSSDTDTRVIVATVNKSGTQAITAATSTKVTGFGVSLDPANLWDAANNQFKVNVSGYYRVAGLCRVATGTASISARVNGSTVYEMSAFVPVLVGGAIDIPVKLNAGDTVEMMAYCSVNDTISATSTMFQIARLSGPATIAANETIACEYNTGAANAIANSTETIIDFGTKESDTHGCVLGAGGGNKAGTSPGTGWRFVAPVSGRFLVTGIVTVPTGTTGTVMYTTVRVNGVDKQYGGLVTMYTGTQNEMSSVINAQVRCKAGDYIEIIGYQQTGGSVNMEASAVRNRVSIIRSGNY